MKSKIFFVNNAVFDRDISTNSTLVYLYLCKCANAKGQCFPSHKNIAAACGISVTTVKKALLELENAGLIETQGQKRLNKGTRSNLYTVYNDRTDGYFKAPYFIFDMELSTKAKLVFFYFCRLSGNSESVYPAHKTTAKACSLSVAGARKAIDELEANGLITREAQYRADNGQRANLYTLVDPCHDTPDNPTDPQNKKDNATTEEQAIQQPPAEAEQQSSEQIERETIDNTGISQPLPTNNTHPSHLIATTPAKRRLSEIINIIIKINNDIKNIIIKKKESKKIYIYNPIYQVSRHNQGSWLFIHMAREPTTCTI